MLRLLQIATAGILLIQLSTSLHAQSQTTGRIAGSVRDPTGAVIEAADVTATDLRTGESRTAKTNTEGDYAFSFLSPGNYHVEFRAPGFSRAFLDDVQVFITETTTVNVQLRVASAADTITVLGGALQRDGPQLGRVVDSEMVSELPQATRNFTQILPIDVFDGAAGSLYGLNGARPNWTAGADRKAAMTNIPPGYFFNPFAFTRPIVQANQPIPSSHGQAIANASGYDIGDVGRNVLRGPAQRNVDIAVTRRFPLGESSHADLRVEFFNLFNQVNLANPISNVDAVPAPGFSSTGAIVSPGDFGRIFSTSSNPRLVQLALKLNW